jgi:hypothetical protein
MGKTRDTGLETWLDELSAHSLPGGVSAAALASAILSDSGESDGRNTLQRRIDALGQA